MLTLFRSLCVALCALLLMSPAIHAATTDPQAPSIDLSSTVYAQIAQEYLQPFMDTQQNVLCKKPVKENDSKASLPTEIEPLDELTKRTVVFQLFAQREAEAKQPQPRLISTSVWGDLNLLHNRKNPASPFFKQINRTMTTFGEAYLARQFIEIHTDKQLLVKRQNIIKSLMNPEGKQTRLKLEELLKQIKAVENKALTFWHDLDPALQKTIENETPFDWLAQRPMIFNMYEAFEYFGQLESIGAMIYMPVLIYFLIKAIKAGPLAKINAFLANIKVPTPILLGAHHGIIINEEEADKNRAIYAVNNNAALQGFFKEQHNAHINGRGTDLLLNLALLPFLIQPMYRFVSEGKTFRRALHLQVNALALLLKSTEKISALAHTLPLRSSLHHLDATSRLRVSQNGATTALKELMTLMNDKKFAHNPGAYSLNGKMFKARHLINKVKDSLIDAFQAVGEIDMYCSLARLMEEHQGGTNANGQPITYCFVDYEAHGAQPHIKIDNFWNPNIPDKKVIVPNNLEMGGALTYRNMLLTGPNTGGKSCTLNAIILSVLLAQSLGIAPAEQMSLTPFSHFITHLNITDDPTKGESKFMAEGLRAISMLETVQGAKEGEDCLALVDEIFSGTEPMPAKEAAYAFAELIGQYPHVTAIVATHYTELTQLQKATQGIYRNFCVSVTKDDQGKLEFPHQLSEGVANVNVALDILRDQLKKRGMSAAFLDKAQERLDARRAEQNQAVA